MAVRGTPTVARASCIGRYAIAPRPRTAGYSFRRLAQMKKPARSARAARCRPRCVSRSCYRLHRNNGDDSHVLRIDDDEFVPDDKIEKAAPLGLDLHQRLR